MRVIGKRELPKLTALPTAAALVEAARHSDTLVALAGGHGKLGVRKGVYRFANHAAQNRADMEAIAEQMAALAYARAMSAVKK
jgi:hypothetical protein